MYAIFTKDPEVLELARSKGEQISLIHVKDNECSPTPITNTESIVSEFLQKELSIPVHFVGFIYLKDIFLKSLENDGFERKAMTSKVYPYCAKLNNTTISSVERGIRHSIQRAHKKHDPTKYEEIFGSNAQMSNTAFIRAAIAYFKKQFVL